MISFAKFPHSALPSKHTETSTCQARPFTNTFYRPAQSYLR